MSQAFLLAEAESAEHGAAASHAEGHGAGHHKAELSVISEHWMVGTPYGQFHMDTVLSTVFAMAIALIAFGLLGRSVAMRPSDVKVKRASAVEQIIGFIQKILDDFVGKGSSKYLWFIGSLFVFILVANWLALLPWAAWQLSGLGFALADALHIDAPHGLVYHAPTADLNTTVALSLLSLAMYWVAGIAKNGLGGFLGHHWFARPFILFPLRMLEDITRPVSLALRLFANILAGHIVGTVLLGMTLVGAAALLPLETFVGAIQAFIFATLSASYIGGAVQEHH